MKILYITGGKSPDYLNDSIFHGLRELFGAEVVDSHCLAYMYSCYTTAAEKEKLYGKGFTLYATLPNDGSDRTDLFNKIRNRYFNVVIYGSVWRCQHYLKTVAEFYPSSHIILLDGEDHSKLHPLHKKYPYFKRELGKFRKGVYPVSLSVPKEKTLAVPVRKEKMFATIIPGNKTTYIFNNETDYYQDYAASYFGHTGKKGGWDCLRHYEILASGCVPFFKDLRKCPPQTLFNFPKELCLKTMELTQKKSFEEEKYFDLQQKIFGHYQQYLTTEKVATYLINTLRLL